MCACLMGCEYSNKRSTWTAQSRGLKWASSVALIVLCWICMCHEALSSDITGEKQWQSQFEWRRRLLQSPVAVIGDELVEQSVKEIEETMVKTKKEGEVDELENDESEINEDHFQVVIDSSEDGKAMSTVPTPVFVVDFGRNVTTRNPLSLFTVSGSKRIDVIYSKDLGLMYVMASVKDMSAPGKVGITVTPGVTTDLKGIPNGFAQKIVEYVPGNSSSGAEVISDIAGWGMLGTLALSFGAASISPSATVGVGAMNFAGFVQTFYMTGNLPITNMPENYRSAAQGLDWVGLNPPVGPVAPSESSEEKKSKEVLLQDDVKLPYPPVDIVARRKVDSPPSPGIMSPPPASPEVEDSNEGSTSEVLIVILPEQDLVDDNGLPPNPFNETNGDECGSGCSRDDDEGSSEPKIEEMEDSQSVSATEEIDPISKPIREPAIEPPLIADKLEEDTETEEGTYFEALFGDDIDLTPASAPSVNVSTEQPLDGTLEDMYEDTFYVYENPSFWGGINNGQPAPGPAPSPDNVPEAAPSPNPGAPDSVADNSTDTSDSSTDGENGTGNDEMDQDDAEKEDTDDDNADGNQEDETEPEQDQTATPPSGDQEESEDKSPAPTPSGNVTKGPEVENIPDKVDKVNNSTKPVDNEEEEEEEAGDDKGGSDNVPEEEDAVIDNHVEEEHDKDDTERDTQGNQGDESQESPDTQDSVDDKENKTDEKEEEKTEEEAPKSPSDAPTWVSSQMNTSLASNKTSVNQNNKEFSVLAPASEGERRNRRKLLLVDPLSALTSSGFSYVVTTATPDIISQNMTGSTPKTEEAIGASVMSRIRAIQSLADGDAEEQSLDILWNVLFWSGILLAAILAIHLVILLVLWLLKVDEVPKMLHLPRLELLAFMMILPMITAAGAACLQSTSPGTIAAGVIFGIVIPFGFLLGAGIFLMLAIIRPTISKRRAVYVVEESEAMAAAPTDQQIAMYMESRADIESSQGSGNNLTTSMLGQTVRDSMAGDDSSEAADSEVTTDTETRSGTQPPARRGVRSFMYNWILSPLFGFSSPHRAPNREQAQPAWLGRMKLDAVFVKRFGCFFEDAHGPQVYRVSSRYDSMASSTSDREFVGAGILVPVGTQGAMQVLQTYGIIFAAMKMVLFAVIINSPGGVNNVAQVVALLLVALLHVVYLRVCVPYRLRIELGAEIVAAVCDFAVFVCGIVLIAKKDWTSSERNSMGIAMIALQAVGFLVFITIRVGLALRTASITILPAAKKVLKRNKHPSTTAN